MRGAAELRLKETDRIATVVDGLRGLGADIEAAEDGFAVRGTGGLRGGVMEAHGDHRLAMLGAVAGLASREGVEVVGMEAAAVSYPGFTADLERSSAEQLARAGSSPWRVSPPSHVEPRRARALVARRRSAPRSTRRLLADTTPVPLGVGLAATSRRVRLGDARRTGRRSPRASARRP